MRFFQRLNFFTGLFTTADDWRREQAYHVEKRKLHNRTFHVPGVVPGEGENLAVTATDDGQVKVLSGYAIDGRGRDLYLAGELILKTPPEMEKSDGKEEVIRYVYIAFDEKRRDPRPDNQNPQYSGDAFIEEHPAVNWTDEAPDNRERIELARVMWRAGKPVVKEIDTSRVRYAGASRPVRFVKADEIDLNPDDPDKGMQFVAGDIRVHIKSFGNPGLASGVLYVTNVYPVENFGPSDVEPRILWRVESSMNQKKEVAYHLILKNFGKSKVRVRFEIYRLNSGPMN